MFAIPGSIHSTFSKGSHRLIKEGAKLVESAADILDELGVAAAPSAPVSAPSKRLGGEDVTRVLAALGHDPTGVDALTERTRLPVESVAVALVELEIAGEITALAGRGIPARTLGIFEPISCSLHLLWRPTLLLSALL